jgi:hypothetical protein
MRPIAPPDALERASELAQGLVLENPSIPRFRETEALVVQQKGLQWLAQDDLAKAESELRAARDALAELARKHPDDLHLRFVLREASLKLSRVLARQGKNSAERRQEAITLMEELLRDVLQEHSDNPRARQFLLGYLHHLQAENFRDMGDTQQAAESQKKADELRRRPRPER